MQRMDYRYGLIFLCVSCFIELQAKEVIVTEPWPSPVPNFEPLQPSEHPRLVFRKADLPELRKRAERAEGKIVIERLRKILNGGEEMPLYYNTNTPVNSGAKGPGQLPADAYTLWHGAGFGLLYQITGNKKYADLGRQCVEKAFAGVPDRDERYGWTSPMGMLRAGPSVRAIALAYDLCYDGWDEAFRRRVALEIQNYGKSSPKGPNGEISVEALALSPRHHANSNHFGMQVGGVCVALLAIKGDPGVDDELIERYLTGVRKNLKSSILQGHGDRAYYPEGHHCGRMTANGIVPAFQALKRCLGEDWIANCVPAQWLVTKWIFELTNQGGGPLCLMRDRYASNGFNRRGQHCGDFAQGFGIIPDQYKAQLLWVYNHIVCPDEPKDFDVTDYPQRAIYALANWPFDLEEKHPATIFDPLYRDNVCLYFAMRNGWSEKDDIQVTAYMGGGRYGAYGAGKGGQTLFAGLGMRGAFPGGFYQSSCSYFRSAKDGSALISSIKIYTHLAVDFSKASGVECVVAMLGKGAGVKQWLNSGNVTNEATGASAITQRIQAGPYEYYVMTIQRAKPPEIAAEGESIRVGGQRIGFNGKHLTLKVMGEGPEPYDPGGAYREYEHKPIPADKLFDPPPPPTEAELRQQALAAARSPFEKGRPDRAIPLLIEFLKAYPSDSEERTQAEELLKKLEFAAAEELYRNKQFAKAKSQLQVFIGKYRDTPEAQKAARLIEELDTDALLGGP